MFVSIETENIETKNLASYENSNNEEEDFEEDNEQENVSHDDNADNSNSSNAHSSNLHNTHNSLNSVSEEDDNDNLKYASKCTSYCDGNEYKLVMLSARIAHDIHAGKKNALQNAVEWDKPTAQAIISIGRDPSKPAKILDEILNTSGDASTSIVSVSDFDFFEQDDTNNNVQADDTVASEIAALSALNNI